VAATRARDLLVVPALGDGRDGEGGAAERDDEWWLDALHPALYPAKGRRRTPDTDPVSARELAVPPFGPESVLERLDRDGAPRATPPESVAPGLHLAETGNPVVWWDPAVLDLGIDAPAGKRQQRLLEVDDEVQPTLSVEEGIGRYEAWRTARSVALEAGSASSWTVHTVKGLAKAAAERGASAPTVPTRFDVRWIEVPRPASEDARSGGRPGGPRFGDLVHRVLASLPLGAAEEAIRAAVAAYARGLGSTKEEAETAVTIVGRALASPIIRQAAEIESADRDAVRRELPLHTVSGDGAIVEGVADLAFRDPGVAGAPRWLVVDYKTDLEIGDARPVYETQVAGYAAAVTAATGEPALAVVLVL